MPNDTHANILLNIIIKKYGCLPDRYKIVGFDNSPISKEAIIPISTSDAYSYPKRNFYINASSRLSGQ